MCLLLYYSALCTQYSAETRSLPKDKEWVSALQMAMHAGPFNFLVLL